MVKFNSLLMGMVLLAAFSVNALRVENQNQDLQEQTESKVPPGGEGDTYRLENYAEFTDAEKTKLNELYSKAGYTEAQQAKCLRKNDPANAFTGVKRADTYCPKDTCEEITPSRFGYAAHWTSAIIGHDASDASGTDGGVGAKHSHGAYACIPRTSQCETLAGSDAHAWAQNKAMYPAGSCYPILWDYAANGAAEGGVAGSPGQDGGLPNWAWGRSGQTESEQASEAAISAYNFGSYVPKTPLEERGTACQVAHDPNKDYPCWRGDSESDFLDYAAGSSRPSCLASGCIEAYDAKLGRGEWLYWRAGGLHFPSSAEYDGKTCREKMTTFKAATLARWTYPNATLYKENCIEAAGCSWDVQMGCAATADVEAMAEIVCANVGALGTYWADIKRYNLAAIKAVQDIIAKTPGGSDGVATHVCKREKEKWGNACGAQRNGGFSRESSLDEVKQLVSDFEHYSAGYLMGDCATIGHIAKKWANAVKGLVGYSEAKLGKVPFIGPVLVVLARVVVLAQYTLQSKTMPEGSIFGNLPSFSFKQTEAKAPVNMKQPGAYNFETIKARSKGFPEEAAVGDYVQGW